MIADVRHAPSDAPLRAYAWSPAVRVLAGVLHAVSRVSLPAIAVGLATTSGVVILPTIARLLGILVAVPALAVHLLRRTAAASVTFADDALVVARRDARIDVPYASIAAVVPWRIALPGPGVSLRLRSGRILRPGLEMRDPTPLVDALARRTGVPTVAADARILWAHARASRPRRWWSHPLVKFPGFALLPTALVFNLHQHIAYGGFWGQWYLESPWHWTRTLLVYWGLWTSYVLLYASVVRTVGEAAAAVGTAAAPARANGIRRVVEAACGLAYYVGLPVAILVPLLR